MTTVWTHCVVYWTDSSSSFPSSSAAESGNQLGAQEALRKPSSLRRPPASARTEAGEQLSTSKNQDPNTLLHSTITPGTIFLSWISSDSEHLGFHFSPLHCFCFNTQAPCFSNSLKYILEALFADIDTCQHIISVSFSVLQIASTVVESQPWQIDSAHWRQRYRHGLLYWRMCCSERLQSLSVNNSVGVHLKGIGVTL